ncbi:hypothetical protein CLF_109596 [Clonorchis sinensis]|uniref:Uncharacterized protein n=1 Tax=Clonorchis sinensis TaxID=79923 RepID=G7YSS2_CLOSI|nr:hypothetical protein CLF_109596 [Clonorchis sinensis]
MGLRSTIITVTVDYLYTDGIDQISAAIHIYHNLIEFNQKVFVTGPQELEVKLQQTICKSSAESAGILRIEYPVHRYHMFTTKRSYSRCRVDIEYGLIRQDGLDSTATVGR